MIKWAAEKSGSRLRRLDQIPFEHLGLVQSAHLIKYISAQEQEDNSHDISNQYKKKKQSSESF